MDIKTQAIAEYFTQRESFGQLAAKYGVSHTTINKWVQIHQGIHNTHHRKAAELLSFQYEQ